ncbi:MAG: MBL fold metallo-hydrolase [Clostridia bacterium]|nr:MBL fold metallo-hydrolase [Clostridia bacterium]
MNSVYTLYSGSSGNSVYFNLCGHEFLIDAGKSARTLCNALKSIGTDISNIEAIFITHEHTDHIGALEVLTKKHHVPVHVCGRSSARLRTLGEGGLFGCLVEHSPICEVAMGEVKVKSFVTPHDSMGSVGYRIEYEAIDDDGKSECCAIGLATDIGHVDESVRAGLFGCRDVILESNHDIDMLMCGPYPEVLKMRIMSRRGHLSNVDCAAFAAELCVEGTQNILLAHLSEVNNEPSLALTETVMAVGNDNIHIAVADRDIPSRLF